jgi:hypothetical protein
MLKEDKMLIRDSFQLYREEFGKILMLGLIVIVPIQFLCILINNYLYFYYWLPQIHIADLFYGINMLIAGSLVQIPFIKLFDSYQKREYIEFSSAYGSFWQYGFVVFVMSVLYTLGVVTGTFLLLIPGLVLMVLFNAFPFAVVLDEKKWWEGFKQAFQFGKSNFWKLFGIIFGFLIVELAVEWIVQSITFLFTDRYLVVASVVMLVNMLFVPIVTFATGLLYQEWREQPDTVV